MKKAPEPKHIHSPLKFPDGFLWGAATSAHQVEGNNNNNDWWEFEQTLPENMRSGTTGDQYHLFKTDLALAKQFNHNAHRLSIEWSRIEPEKGQFNEVEIEHYREVLSEIKNQGMKIMLTLHHFTNPLWISHKGGWANPQTSGYFASYTEKVVSELGQYVDFWVTINEPSLVAGQSYLRGIFPPQKKSWLQTFWVIKNLSDAHKKAYKIIHAKRPHAQVGIANNTVSFRTLQAHSLMQHLLIYVYDFFANHLFYFLSNIKTHDFLGINYYFHERIGSVDGDRFPRFLNAEITQKEVSDLGWEIHPEGIFDILEDLSDYKKPIYISENGLASTNDDRRCRFLISYLKEIYHATLTGVDVRGYFHWSLIDNFEWEHGFDPRFGLIEVDYDLLDQEIAKREPGQNTFETKSRKPRQSAYVYADIIRHNGISHDLLRFIGHTIDAKEVLRRHQD